MLRQQYNPRIWGQQISKDMLLSRISDCYHYLLIMAGENQPDSTSKQPATPPGDWTLNYQSTHIPHTHISTALPYLIISKPLTISRGGHQGHRGVMWPTASRRDCACVLPARPKSSWFSLADPVISMITRIAYGTWNDPWWTEIRSTVNRVRTCSDQ